MKRILDTLGIVFSPAFCTCLKELIAPFLMVIIWLSQSFIKPFIIPMESYLFTSKKNQGFSSLKTITCLFLVCLFSACSVIRVLEVDSPSASGAGSGQHFSNDTIIRVSMWKGRKGKQDIKSLCPNGISRVKITTKPMDIVLGFVTVGFVVKQRIEWDCSQRSGTSDMDE